ncbi:MAG: hypothetical protein M1823_008815, partial [Watsoniomyces obsoletus]
MNVIFADKAPETATSDVMNLQILHGPDDPGRALCVWEEGYGICLCDVSRIAVAQEEDHRYS